MKLMNSFKLALLSVLILATACQNTKQTKDERSEATSSELKSNVNVPAWSEDAVIYEVNIRQYTKEGTIAAFKEHLPRLKELGVEILWFMPMHPISEKNRKGTLGSYYAIQDYKAINPEYGTMEEFKALVNECHEMGFKVLLDWVANHTGWDNQWIIDHPEWYQQDSLGNVMIAADWTDVAQLNYDKVEMHDAMIDALKFWVSDADIDGYRCDVAGMVPVTFWNKARTALDQIKPVYMLAEDEGEEDLLKDAFNSNYGWEFHHIMNKIAKGSFGPKNVIGYFEKVDSTYPLGSYAMQFTSNHDENSWSGNAPKRLGDAIKPMAVLSFMVPGMPLIYSGQEAGLNKDLAFYEKDEISWETLPLQSFYQELILIKQDNKALWNGSAGGKIHFLKQSEENALLTFSRTKDDNKILVLMNLSAEELENTITCETIEGNYIDLFSASQETYSKNQLIKLGPWEYKILKAD